MANFKRLFKVPTQNGKLGLGEKSASRKMLMQDYGLNDNFFKEIDASVKRNCRTQNDIQSYLFMYQGFSNDLMMLMGNLMQWKFRMPSIFKKALYGMTQKTVHDVCTKTVWKADDVQQDGYGCPSVQRTSRILRTMDDGLCLQYRSSRQERTETEERRHRDKKSSLSEMLERKKRFVKN